MSTTIGKVMVFFHTVFSLALMTVALVLWLNRVDWSDQPAKEGQSAGLLVEPKQEYKRVSEGVRDAHERWLASRTWLSNQEQTLAGARAWYDQQLNLLTLARREEGRGDVPKPPLPALEINRSPAPGLLVGGDMAWSSLLLPTTAKDREGNPLKLYPAADYDELMKIAYNRGQELSREIKTAAELEKRETEKLTGPKKLYDRIASDQEKRDLIIQEYDDLKEPLINTLVELQNLESQRERLTKRLKELEALATEKKP